MSPSSQQIVTAYEDAKMTPEEIASELEFDVEAVKATLMQFSSQFLKDSKKNPSLDFSDDQLAESNGVLVRLMRETEDEHLQYRVAKYIRQDKKGRLDKVAFKHLHINAVVFNQQLARARKALSDGVDKVIEVVSSSDTENNTPNPAGS